MATENELLEALNTEQAVISKSDLAGKVQASVEGTRKQLKRLRDKTRQGCPGHPYCLERGLRGH